MHIFRITLSIISWAWLASSSSEKSLFPQTQWLVLNFQGQKLTWALWSGGRWGRASHCPCGSGLQERTESGLWNSREISVQSYRSTKQPHGPAAEEESWRREVCGRTTVQYSPTATHPFSILPAFKIFASLFRPRRLLVMSSFMLLSSILIWASA